jgi:hypothetical protein
MLLSERWCEVGIGELLQEEGEVERIVIATSIPSALQAPSSHDLRYMRRQQHVPHVPRGCTLHCILLSSEQKSVAAGRPVKPTALLDM